jgi:hypothetical protein
MQGAGDIWWRQGHDEFARRQNLTIGAEFGFEEAALLPPRVPARLDGLRGIRGEMRMIEVLQDLLLARGSRVDEGGERGGCGIGRFWFRRCRADLFGLLCLLCGEFGSFGRLCLLLCN